MDVKKDQHKGTACCTPVKEQGICPDHHKDKSLCADQHQTKPVVTPVPHKK